MSKSQHRSTLKKKKLENMTPPKVNNCTRKDQIASDGKEISNFELKE
jgi:hypothetical protein